MLENRYFGRWRNQARFLFKLSSPKKSEARLEYFRRLVVRVDWKIVSDFSPERQSNEETDVYCVWQGRRLFCEFPTGVGVWGFVEEDVRKNMGLEFSYLRYVQSSGDLIGCVWKIRGLDFELCRGRNFIEWANKRFGWFRKEHPVF